MNLLTDLWYDLREKRLWPVAVALLVALIAVPVILLKPASEEATVPVAAKPAEGVPGIPVASTAAGNTDDSRLEVFNPKDPFKPLVVIGSKTARSVARTATGGSGSDASAGGDSDSGVGSSGSSGSSGAGDGLSAGGPGDTSGGSDSGSGGTGSGGGTPGSGGGTPGSGGGTPAPAKPTTYTYTVDVRFGERSNPATRRGVQRLEPLPNDRNPLLVFLGVTADTKGAVFLVNSRLDQEGEGDCQPSNNACTFLELRDQDLFDEHLFVDRETGKEYYLQLQKINRVSVETAARQAARKAEVARKAEAARSASTSSTEPRIFELPLFGDTVQ
jgi:hypothetical protein